MPVPTRPPQAPQVTRPAGPVSLEGIVERVTFESAASSYRVIKLAVAGRSERLAVVGSFPPTPVGARVRVRGLIEHDHKHGEQLRAESLIELAPDTLGGTREVPRVRPHQGSGTEARAAHRRDLRPRRAARARGRHRPPPRGRGPGRQAARGPGAGMARPALDPRRDGLPPGARREPRPRDAHRASLRAARDERRLARALPARARRERRGLQDRRPDRGHDRRAPGLAAAHAGGGPPGRARPHRGGAHLDRARRRDLARRADAGARRRTTRTCAHASIARSRRASSWVASFSRRAAASASCSPRRCTRPRCGSRRGWPSWRARARSRSQGVAEAIERFEAQARVELAPEQRSAVEEAARRQALVVTGGPGVGKTTIVRAILAVLARVGRRRATRRADRAGGQAAERHDRRRGDDPAPSPRVRSEVGHVQARSAPARSRRAPSWSTRRRCSICRWPTRWRRPSRRARGFSSSATSTSSRASGPAPCCAT